MTGDARPTARQLSEFTKDGYDKGRSLATQLAWLVVRGTFLQRWFCPVPVRRAILRIFGARIGVGVFIRHDVRIHWPWKLEVGAHSWIGEGAWLLNLEPIVIGSNVCISQGVVLCTGSHDRRSRRFAYDNGPIHIEDGAWLALRSTVLRGVTVGRDAVVGAGALITADVEAGALLVAPRAIPFDRAERV